MCSLGIEPTTFCAADAMLYHWATQEHAWQLKCQFPQLIYTIEVDSGLKYQFRHQFSILSVWIYLSMQEIHL